MRLPLDLSTGIRVARARRSPQLAFAATDVRTLLEETRNELFPRVNQTLETWFVEDGPLACVHYGPDRAVVFVHALLNHHKTPVGVFRLIAVHELLHLVIEPRVVDGVLKQHPPEFFREEESLVPERSDAYFWIYQYLYDALTIDRKREGIFVKRSWRSVWQRLNRTDDALVPKRFRRPSVDFM